MNLRERFEVEADSLWGHLARLARKHPRLEGLYARDADPRVARMVQSAAFAFAMAANRLNDDGQALVRPLVARALAESLRPRPSSTILELTNSEASSGPARGATFDAWVGAERLPFEVRWPAAGAPIALDDVALDRLDARRQALRFSVASRSGVSLAQGLQEVVRLFVHLEPRSVALDLLHALRRGASGRARWLDAHGHCLAENELRDAVRWVRVDTDEAPLVSARPDRFASGTMLRDLFEFAESYCFFDLHIGERRVPGAERVEVVLPLAHLVEGVAHVSARNLRLFCTPATNQFVAPIDPLPDAPQQASVCAAGKPHAEMLEVRALTATSVRSARERKLLRSWEAPATPHTFDASDTYYSLEQRLGVDDRTELRVMFGRVDAFPSSPGGIVEGEVVASDGALTSGLGLGDVGSEKDGARNITRVTPSRRAVLGRNYGWRVSAYARMPAGRLGRRAHLAELLALHDLFGPHDEAVGIARPTILHADHAQEHELEDGALAWGDLFTVDVDAPGLTKGALWLVGELLHRALAERAEGLRFVRLVLQTRGAPFAEYAPRSGTRLPFPLG